MIGFHPRRMLQRMRRGGLRDNVAFVHLPKCGGSSIHGAIEACCTSGKVQRIDVVAATRVARFLGIDEMLYQRDITLCYLARGGNGQYLGGHLYG